MGDNERALIRVDIAPLVPTETAHNRLAEIRQFVKEELREGLDGDFAVIPGTGKKPSLLQPGAEKLIEKLGLTPTFPIKELVYEDWERGEFGVDTLCRLISPNTGQAYAECWGSAARSAQEEVDESNAKAREYATRDGKPVPPEKPLRFSHKGLARNTAMKMAQKSALVGATLKAARLAVDFTQDVEDFGRPGGAPAQGQAQARPGGGEHWCAEHKTEWFMRGNMKNYAHPIGDTGKWCNEPKPKEEPAKKVTGEILDPPARAPERPQEGRQGHASPIPPEIDLDTEFGANITEEDPEVWGRECAELENLKAQAGITDENFRRALDGHFKPGTTIRGLNPAERKKLKMLLEGIPSKPKV